MDHTNLQDLITCLVYGTNLHICIGFFQNYGNFKTNLVFENMVHAKPFCRYMQDLPGGTAKCIKCRNLAEKRVLKERKAFGGICFNGIYEYCHPVIYNNDVAAIIFIGNILKKTTPVTHPFEHTFEKNFDPQQCELIASVLDNQIQLLLKEYSGIKNDYYPLVNNIKTYVDSYLYTDLTMCDLSAVFGYNEKYLGKLFKKHTGETIKEYINRNRLTIAAKMLTETPLSVIDISIKTGFNNVTYFNRLFKKKYGVAPGEYRKTQNAK